MLSLNTKQICKNIFPHISITRLICEALSLLTLCPRFSRFSQPSSFFPSTLYHKSPPVAPADSLPSCRLPRPPIKPLPSQASLVQRPGDSWGRALIGSNTDMHTGTHTHTHNQERVLRALCDSPLRKGKGGGYNAEPELHAFQFTCVLRRRNSWPT